MKGREKCFPNTKYSAKLLIKWKLYLRLFDTTVANYNTLSKCSPLTVMQCCKRLNLLENTFCYCSWGIVSSSGVTILVSTWENFLMTSFGSHSTFCSDALAQVSQAQSTTSRISHLESLAEGRSAWSCERGCDSAWLSRHGWRPLGTKEICWCSEPPLDVCHQPPTCWPALTPPGQPGSTDLQSKERMEQLVSCPLPPWGGAILMLQYKSTLARAKLTTRSLVMQQ